ncbi:unnamed protein product [Paramecium primaurelia]|uniref:Uncharacterized protein n=1 Tax=Paramecium primaurelia TaxID=5886 RepID=A0A8S1NB80_PARPR|nr:unnamed protein product [Paramecium primaurelia]
MKLKIQNLNQNQEQLKQIMNDLQLKLNSFIEEHKIKLIDNIQLYQNQIAQLKSKEEIQWSELTKDKTNQIANMFSKKIYLEQYMMNQKLKIESWKGGNQISILLNKQKILANVIKYYQLIQIESINHSKYY